MHIDTLKVGETYHVKITVSGTHDYIMYNVNGTRKIIKREGLIPMKDIKVYASDTFYNSAKATISKMHFEEIKEPT